MTEKEWSALTSGGCIIASEDGRMFRVVELSKDEVCEHQWTVYFPDGLTVIVAGTRLDQILPTMPAQAVYCRKCGIKRD